MQRSEVNTKCVLNCSLPWFFQIWDFISSSSPTGFTSWLSGDQSVCLPNARVIAHHVRCYGDAGKSVLKSSRVCTLLLESSTWCAPSEVSLLFRVLWIHCLPSLPMTPVCSWTRKALCLSSHLGGTWTTQSDKRSFSK